MKHICMALIRFYRRFLSRLKPTPTCRFYPSCSAYALEAFEKRGFFVGFALTIWRILRCSPLSPCGYDPVPEKGFRTMPMRWSKYDRPKPEESSEAEESSAFDDDTLNTGDDLTQTQADQSAEDTDKN